MLYFFNSKYLSTVCLFSLLLALTTSCSSVNGSSSHNIKFLNEDSRNQALNSPQENENKPEEDQQLTARLQKMASKPLTPDQTSELVDTAAGNFFYGPSLGETALDIIGMIAFPPYAVVVAGNSALSLAGYKPLSIKRVLPDDVAKGYTEATDTIYSGPGRVVAGVSGNQYRKRDEVKERWNQFAKKVEEERAISGHTLPATQPKS